MRKATYHQLRHLEGKHHELDIAVQHLMRRGHLTPGEYEQALALKKRKLMLKDDIEALRQDLQR